MGSGEERLLFENSKFTHEKVVERKKVAGIHSIVDFLIMIFQEY